MKIDCSPYPIKLTVYTDLTSFSKAYHKLKGTYPDTTSCNGYTAYLENEVILGVFSKDILTLVHELNHVCLFVFDWIGLPINSTTSEAYCYYMDHLLKQCLPLVEE